MLMDTNLTTLVTALNPSQDTDMPPQYTNQLQYMQLQHMTHFHHMDIMDTVDMVIWALVTCLEDMAMLMLRLKVDTTPLTLQTTTTNTQLPLT